MFGRVFSEMSKTRIESFSDGVFAIVCTLLVFSFTVPRLSGPDLEIELKRYIVRMLPTLASYAMSFALVTMYWVAHHQLFKILDRTDAPFLWLNNLFLMWLALLPFPAHMMGDYPTTESAILLFGGTTLLVAIGFACTRYYAFFVAGLVNGKVARRSLRRSMILSSIGISLLAAALLVSYLSDSVTMTMYGLVPFLCFVPVRFKSFAVGSD
jgi:uncharacterized membrane protein